MKPTRFVIGKTIPRQWQSFCFIDVGGITPSGGSRTSCEGLRIPKIGASQQVETPPGPRYGNLPITGTQGGQAHSAPQAQGLLADIVQSQKTFSFSMGNQIEKQGFRSPAVETIVEQKKSIQSWGSRNVQALEPVALSGKIP